MQALSATASKQEDATVAVTGVAGRVTPSNDALTAATLARRCEGLLAPQSGPFTLVGDASLSRRPMERIRKPLQARGARLTLRDHSELALRAFGAQLTRTVNSVSIAEPPRDRCKRAGRHLFRRILPVAGCLVTLPLCWIPKKASTRNLAQAAGTGPL
jgi:hypothetical protein